MANLAWSSFLGGLGVLGGSAFHRQALEYLKVGVPLTVLSIGLGVSLLKTAAPRPFEMDTSKVFAFLLIIYK